MPPTPRFAALQPCSRSVERRDGVLVERDRRARTRVRLRFASADCAQMDARAAGASAPGPERRECETGFGGAAPRRARAAWRPASARCAAALRGRRPREPDRDQPEAERQEPERERHDPAPRLR